MNHRDPDYNQPSFVENLVVSIVLGVACYGWFLIFKTLWELL